MRGVEVSLKSTQIRHTEFLCGRGTFHREREGGRMSPPVQIPLWPVKVWMEVEEQLFTALPPSLSLKSNVLFHGGRG